MRKIISILALILCLLSCSDKVKFDQAIHKLFTDEELEDISYIVVIPSAGCAGCILGVENYYIQNKNLKRVKYLFSNIISIKELQIKNIKESFNTKFDIENIIMSAYPSEMQIYPSVISINNGNVEEIYYHCPDYNALNLLKQLK